MEVLAESEYWPNDPDFAYAGVNYSESVRPGQWWLYSFVPERARNAPLLRQPGLASGLSVDAAWRYGLGKPNVVVVFIDDGIDWSQPELADRIVLNSGELLHFPPSRQDQQPCAQLVPSDPKSPRFDCAMPPDGALTVKDYAARLGWTDGQQGTDPNGNGVLDPGDLVLLGSNVQDDDGNGFVDDIAGWDFVDSDGIPEHVVTRRGTEVALDAIADANDGIGRAGACPGCLGLPIRLADQRGADPQRLALAILYAVSRGASAALVGHLPAGRSATLSAAVRSAAQRGMVALFPQDGEQRSHAPIQFDFDTWFPVGSVTIAGDANSATKASSFVALDPCQTFPSGFNYVGAGPPCSRRSNAVVLGIAGLVASVGPYATGPEKLTAAELTSTMKLSSGVIDIALTSPTDTTSASPASIRRINANSAVERARAGLIPPELNVNSPSWYEPIQLDRQKTPISITGRVSSNRADSLDLEVSVAAGDSPSEIAFQVQSTKEGLEQSPKPIDSSTLALLDLRTWLQTNSLSRERPPTNGTLVTIRIKATAHYKEPVATAASLVERRVVLLEDSDLLQNAPYRIGTTPTAPRVVDVNGDGVADIVFATMDGRLLAMTAHGDRLAELPPRPIYTKMNVDFSAMTLEPLPTSILEGTPVLAENLGHSPIVAAPSVGDLDADGVPEIVAATLDGRLYAVHADGTFLPGWNHVILPRVAPRCGDNADPADCVSVSSRLERGISSSPVLADINGDGHQEVVVAAHDGQVHAYSSDGTPVPGWPLPIGAGASTQPGRLIRSPAVGDFNGDSIDDLLITAGEEYTNGFGRGLHYLVLGATTPLAPRIADGWPVGVDSYDLLADKLDRSTPGASIDGSSTTSRALLYGNSTQPFFVPLDPGVVTDSEPAGSDGQLPSAAEPVSTLDGKRGFSLSRFGAQTNVTSATQFAPMLARPSIGDLDRDGIADVVLPGLPQQPWDATRSNVSTEHRAMLGLYSGRTGQMLPGAPIALPNFVGTAGAAIADLTNDGYPEVIISDGSGSIIAVDACGRNAPGWPKFVGGAVDGTPAVGDINGDGLLEVIVTTREGWLFVWKTPASAQNYVAWSSELNDPANHSNYLNVVDPTAPHHPWQLPIDADGRCVEPDPTEPSIGQEEPKISARGGCSCRFAASSEPIGIAWVLAAGLFLVGSARRRVKRSN